MQTFIMALSGISFLLIALIGAAVFGRDVRDIERDTGFNDMTEKQMRGAVFDFTIACGGAVLAAACLLFAR